MTIYSFLVAPTLFVTARISVARREATSLQLADDALRKRVAILGRLACVTTDFVISRSADIGRPGLSCEVAAVCRFSRTLQHAIKSRHSSTRVRAVDDDDHREFQRSFFPLHSTPLLYAADASAATRYAYAAAPVDAAPRKARAILQRRGRASGIRRRSAVHQCAALHRSISSHFALPASRDSRPQASRHGGSMARCFRADVADRFTRCGEMMKSSDGSNDLAIASYHVATLPRRNFTTPVGEVDAASGSPIGRHLSLSPTIYIYLAGVAPMIRQSYSRYDFKSRIPEYLRLTLPLAVLKTRSSLVLPE